MRKNEHEERLDEDRTLIDRSCLHVDLGDIAKENVESVEKFVYIQKVVLWRSLQLRGVCEQPVKFALRRFDDRH